MEDETGATQPNTGRPLTQVQKRAARDKDRKRKGKSHKKRVPLLQHRKIKAFLGWKTEPEPWTYKTVNKYVDWCHINKLFPHWRHKIHLGQNKANLAYCKDKVFMHRCLEVWMELYGEPKPYRNDNFCFFLVQMVYAEYILKKEVNWSTLKELLVGDHPEEASIAAEGQTIDLKKLLARVKPGKLAVLDEEVVWSPNSSSDEHTHEYDGYNFTSDDEDVDMGDPKKALELELAKKGKRKVEELETPSNIQEQGMEDNEHMGVRQIIVEGHQDGREGDEEDNEYVMLVKLESAMAAFELAKKDVAELRKIRAMELNAETSARAMPMLKEEMKAVNKAISENDKYLASLRTSRDQYYKKKQEKHRDLQDVHRVLQQKLKILGRERWRVQNDVRLLNCKIDEEEKKNFVAALQCASELDFLAMAPEYGTTEEEVSTLRKLIKLHEKKIVESVKEVGQLNSQIHFEGAWMKWKRQTTAQGVTREDLEEIGPEPKEEDFRSNTL